MPKNPIQRIKQLLMPSMRPESRRIAEEALLSPAADTLWEISGSGKPIRTNTAAEVLGRFQRNSAAYFPLWDGVGINPAELQSSDYKENQNNALHALSHEAGHRADFRRNDAPGRNAPFKLPDVELPAPPQGKQVQVAPLEVRVEKPYDPYEKQREARGKVDKYYQTSPEEGYAQAFATAMSILRNTPRFLQEGKTRDDYANALGEAEAFTPGVGGIVEALLKEKVFQKHPLQRVYKKKTESR